MTIFFVGFAFGSSWANILALEVWIETVVLVGQWCWWWVSQDVGSFGCAIYFITNLIFCVLVSFIGVDLLCNRDKDLLENS